MGSKQVPIITTNYGRETCTIAACITSDGDSILPLMIFKYKYQASKKKKKQTEPRKCPKKYENWITTTIPCMTRFTPKGFNTKEIMKEYIKALRLKLEGEIRRVVLLLDSASQHIDAAIEKELEGSNIEIVYIPGGCTSFLQPLYLTINKGLKESIKSMYLEWLDEQQEKILWAKDESKTIQDKKLKKNNNVITEKDQLRTPSYELFRNWFCEAAKSLDKESIQKAFGSCGVTFGLRSFVDLNTKLTTTFSDLIDKIGKKETSEAATDEDEDPYQDNFEYNLSELLKGHEVIEFDSVEN